MKTAVVTGGCGFLGSYLCARLLDSNFRVLCIDNLITGDLKNIEQIIKNKNFEFINHDVSKYVEVEGEVDWILHFASPASPADYLKYPIQTLKVGALGTHNTLGLAKAKKAKYMLASTSEVYGDPLVNPQAEDYWGNVNPIGPRGVYDEAKRFAESLTMAYNRTHKIDTRIVRIFNTYGPRMRHNDGRAVPNFIVQALKGEDLTIYGDGTQTRSFCYVDDLIEGIARLMAADYNQPVNIGNPRELTIFDLASIILDITKSQSRIKLLELPQDDPKVRRPDISKARTMLNWQAKVTTEEGLKRTVEYFKQKIF
ncbi:MAG TPA: SDR family oxidoreductase [Candidatus Omnitrophica bacterium]|nr:SDR family oxidoreductase [Candidatus Omnitrophota bacterium]